MDNNIQIFNNEELGTIRIKGTPDAPLFCLGDVCKMLGLRQGNVRERLEKGVVSTEPLLTSGGIQMVNFVTEDGLYDVILDSRKPEAKRFRKWVTSEVLPTIRKHGAYMTKDTLERAIAEPDFLIQLATTMKEEKAKRLEAEQQCEVQKQIIGEMEKKVSYLDLILSSTSTMTITQIAQDYGMSGQRMNKLLHGLRIQYKVGEQWILYAEYKDKCYVSSETIHFVTSEGIPCTTLNTKWTQKGRLFLYDILKKEGILPKMEWAKKTARDKNAPNETRNSNDLE
ncbi:phage antirepressor [Prevotella sp.]|uniref:phage antirepressor n=1 Tax=Prevotella sp. TaxID=59823 RepID=UPI0027E303B1|nr:phage antirepressor KilAC domain-containing protein [Prevotella sp.]